MADPLDAAPVVTVVITGRRPTSLNKSRTLHYRSRATDDLWWRTRVAQACREAAPTPVLPPARVGIVATPLSINRQHLQDPGGCYPSVKAAVDGLVDAGVIVADTGREVAYVTLLPPEVCGVAGLRLSVHLEAT